MRCCCCYPSSLFGNLWRRFSSGQISFEEWTAMMVGRVGRDQGSFNCGGRHGLTPYIAVYNGLSCDFCGTPIQAGCHAVGCRCVYCILVLLLYYTTAVYIYHRPPPVNRLFQVRLPRNTIRRNGVRWRFIRRINHRPSPVNRLFQVRLLRNTTTPQYYCTMAFCAKPVSPPLSRGPIV